MKEDRQNKEIIKAAAMRLAMEMQQKEQFQQSAHGFTVPKPSACRPKGKDYGKEFEPEAGYLKLWEKCLLAAGVVFALVMCAMLKG